MFRNISVVLCLVGSVAAWPGWGKNKPVMDGVVKDGNVLDTGFAHSPCCDGHKGNDTFTRPMNVVWPSQFVMKWNMYAADYCDPTTNQTCMVPPYYPVPPGDYNVTRGVTYSNSNFRGGAQREQYLDFCIYIWPMGTPDWPCDFINIVEEGQGFLINHGPKKAEWMPDCCIMAKPFHPPPRNFTSLMNFNGTHTYGDSREYLKYGIFIEQDGGAFAYTFWNKP